MAELPPAIAKFIADVNEYTEPLNRAIEATQRFADRTDKAALQARQLGIQARESADKAAAAMLEADDAAKRYADGQLDLAAATRAATAAQKAQLRADLDLIALQDAIAKANKRVEDSEASKGKAAEKTGFMEMSMAKKVFTIASYATGAAEPIAAALTVIVGSLASSIASAGLGLGIFGVVAKSVFTTAATAASSAKTAQSSYTSAVTSANLTYQQSIKDAKTHANVLAAQTARTNALKSAEVSRAAALKTAYAGMSKPQIALAHSITAADNEWHAFVNANVSGVSKIITQGLGLLPNIFRMMQPFMAPVEHALSGIISSLSKAIAPAQQFSTTMQDLTHHLGGKLTGAPAGGLAKFMSTMAAQTGPSLSRLGAAIGNLLGMVGHLLEDFAPFAPMVAGGFDKITAAMDRWAGNLPKTAGFQSMITMFKTQGPTIVAILKNLATIAGQFAKDMAGSASNMLWLHYLPQLTAFVAQFMKGNPQLVEWVMNLMMIKSTAGLVFGKISQLTSGMIGLGKGIGSAVSNTSRFVKGFNSVESAASEATGAAGTWGGRLKSVMTGVPFANFVKGFKSADAAAEESTGAMGTFGGKIKAIFSGIGNLGTGLASPFVNFTKGFKSTEAAASDATGVMGTFGGKVSSMFSSIGGAAVSSAGLIKSAFIGAASGLASGFSAAVSAVKSWTIWSKLAAAAAKVWAAAQWLLDAAMDANPIGLIIIAVAALVAIIILCYIHFRVFRDVINDVGRVIKSGFLAAFNWLKGALTDVMNFIKSHWMLIVAIFLGPVAIVAALVISNWTKIYNFCKSVVSGIISFVKSHWQLIVGIIGGPIAEVVLLVVDNWNRIYSFCRSVVSDIISFIKAHWMLIVAIIGGPIAEVAVLLIKYWHDIESAVQSMVSRVISFFHQLGSDILHIAMSWDNMLYDAGRNLIEGLIRGVEGMVGSAVSAVESAGKSIISAAKSVLGVLSPSTEFAYIGKMIGLGLASGIQQNKGQAEAEARVLGRDVTKAAQAGQISASQAKSLQNQIASSITSGLKQTIVSHLQGTAGQVSHAANQLISMVRNSVGTGGLTWSKASPLITWLQKDNDKLQSLAKKRVSIEQQIGQAEAFATSTAQASEGTYTLASAVQNSAGGTNTPTGIIAQLNIDVGQIRQFSANIQKLGRMGLNKDYLSQLIAMGPQQGGPIAAELVSAGAGLIKQVNTAETQINAASTTLGQSAADVMYDSGKSAGQGFLSGLKAQEKSIQAVMSQIANSMVSTIKKELGIHSPSTVMMQHGKMVAEGFAQGIEQGTRRVAQASSTLASAARTGVTGPGVTGSRGSTIQLTVNLKSQTTGEINKQALWTAVQQQTFRYNIRNSGQVTGVMKPA